MMDHDDRDEKFHVFPSLVWDTALASLQEVFQVIAIDP